MFWKWPISIIGKMLNIGADNRSTPSKNMFLWSLRINPYSFLVTPVDVMSRVFACLAVIDRCLMTPSILKDGATLYDRSVPAGVLICTKDLLRDSYKLHALERGSGHIFLTVLI